MEVPLLLGDHSCACDSTLLAPELPLTLLQEGALAAGRLPHRKSAGGIRACEQHVAGQGLLEAGVAGKGGVSPATAQAFI